MSSIISPSYSLERFSRPRFRKGKCRQTPVIFWIKETNLRVREDQGSKSSHKRVPERRELHMKRISGICRGSSCIFKWVMISASVWGNYLSPEEEPPKRIIDDSASPSHRVLNSAWSHHPEWKASKFTGHWLKYSEGSCISSGEWLALE